MKMECPHCGVGGTVDDSLVGRKVKCPKCVNTFIVKLEGSAPIEVNAMELEAYEVGSSLTNEGIGQPAPAGALNTEDDLDISDLLHSDDNIDEFPSVDCAGCGKAVHPALLMELDSKMYCAGCVPEHILFDENDEEEADSSNLEQTGSQSLTNREIPVDSTDIKKGKNKKTRPNKILKYFLGFLIIALACSAVVVFMDLQLFSFLQQMFSQ